MSDRPSEEAGLLRGRPLAPGYGRGRAVLHCGDSLAVPRDAVAPDEIDSELARFDEARDRAIRDLKVLRLNVAAQAGEDEAAIFAAHMAMLADPSLAAGVRARIREDRENAARAVELEIERLSARMAALEDPYLRERLADVRDIGRRLLKHLIAASSERQRTLPRGAVLVAADLLPSETIDLDRANVAAIVTELGSPTSHAAIMARALGIPAVGGIVDATSRIADGDLLLVDGERGEVRMAPSDAEADAFGVAAVRYARASEVAAAAEDLACVTLDGERVVLAANIGRLEEVAQVGEHHLDGIGLFRTELLFLESVETPSRAEQAALYGSVVRACAGLPVTIRTLDLGGDKLPAFLAPHAGRNPILGLRGLRFSLSHPELFDTQLAAIVDAAAVGPVRILVPMVTGPSDIRAVRKRLNAALARAGRGRERLELGAMIETPAAVFAIEDIAREVDFLSVGTNDLTQFTLAADRLRADDEDCAVHHPSMLKALAQVVRAAQASSRPLSVCGEAAGDPATACLLVGLGVRELSMSPARAAIVRYALRKIRAADARALADFALQKMDPQQVRRALNAFPFARPGEVMPPPEQREVGTRSVKGQGIGVPTRP